MVNDFFAQHCNMFHHRPFVWHLWDGRKDGFNVLVNYHKLCGKAESGKQKAEIDQSRLTLAATERGRHLTPALSPTEAEREKVTPACGLWRASRLRISATGLAGSGTRSNGRKPGRKIVSPPRSNCRAS